MSKEPLDILNIKHLLLHPILEGTFDWYHNLWLFAQTIDFWLSYQLITQRDPSLLLYNYKQPCQHISPISNSKPSISNGSRPPTKSRISKEPSPSLNKMATTTLNSKMPATPEYNKSTPPPSNSPSTQENTGQQHSTSLNQISHRFPTHRMGKCALKKINLKTKKRN